MRTGFTASGGERLLSQVGRQNMDSMSERVNMNSKAAYQCRGLAAVLNCGWGGLRRLQRQLHGDSIWLLRFQPRGLKHIVEKNRRLLCLFYVPL